MQIRTLGDGGGVQDGTVCTAITSYNTYDIKRFAWDPGFIQIHGTSSMDLHWGQVFIRFLAEKRGQQQCATLQKEEYLPIGKRRGDFRQRECTYRNQVWAEKWVNLLSARPNVSRPLRNGTTTLSLLEDSSDKSINQRRRPYEQKQYTKFLSH